MCYHQAAALRDAREDIERAGFRVVLVGIGVPEGAAVFSEAVPFPAELLLLDPERSMHDALSLQKGLRATFLNKATPEAIQRYTFKSFADAAKGYKFVKPPSNEAALQQGGTFVFDGADVLFSHVDQGTADHADMAEVIASLAAAPAPAD